MTILVHSGTSSSDLWSQEFDRAMGLRAGLHSMTGSSMSVTLDMADAALLDPGTVLEHDGEMIQVVNAPQQVRGRQWSVRVARGFGGTTTRRHDPAFWHVAASPSRPAPTEIGPRQIVVWKCSTCGAPAQRGAICHYCRGPRP